MAVELLKRRYRVDTENRIAGDLVTELLRTDPSPVPGALRERAAALGHDLDREQVLAVVSVDASPDRLTDLARRAAATPQRPLVGTHEGALVVVLPAGPDPLAALTRVHERIAGTGRVTTVLGPAGSGCGYAGASSVAVGAAALCSAGAGVVDLRDLGLAGLLLRTGTTAALRAFVDRLLGPIEEQDAWRGSQLGETLRGCLAAGCSVPVRPPRSPCTPTPSRTASAASSAWSCATCGPRRPGWSRNQHKLIAAATFGLVLEFLDYFLIGFVLTFVARPWGLSVGTSAVILLSSGVGAIIGAFLFGRLADRIGRRPVFLLTVAIFSVGTGALILTPDSPTAGPVYLIVFRFLIGLGAGRSVLRRPAAGAGVRADAAARPDLRHGHRGDPDRLPRRLGAGHVRHAGPRVARAVRGAHRGEPAHAAHPGLDPGVPALAVAPGTVRRGPRVRRLGSRCAGRHAAAGHGRTAGEARAVPDVVPASAQPPG